ncbi:MAG: hypothetical protein VX519_03620 [Myxococcota bacterium]|nr:hypothetical protein [Myxococcota bacterium]
MCWWLFIWFGISHAFEKGLLCTEDMIYVEGGSGVLGQLRPAHGEDQVSPLKVEVEDFCIGRFPLPGRPGDHWPEDGLATATVGDWEQLLQAYGMRFCSVEELVWASASGERNLPYASGMQPPEDCEPIFSWPDMKALGHFESCVSPWGLRDLNVTSSWAVSSEQVDEARNASRRAPYVVVGGTNRNDTYYAPTNFGHHIHAQEDAAFFDDQLRVCSDLLSVDAGAWALFQEAMESQGSFSGALFWWEVFGVGASASSVLDYHRPYIRGD